MKRLKKIAVLAAVAVTALLVASVAFGAPGDDGSAKFCSLKYGPHKGEVRLMDSNATACHSSEQSVTLATTASIPTPQPAPKTTTEFAVIDTTNGVPTVQASSGGVTIAYSQDGQTTAGVDFGHSLTDCAVTGTAPVKLDGWGNPVDTIKVNSSGGVHLSFVSDEDVRLVAVCNA